MIKFSLCCDNGHDFEGWFKSNDDFDKQKDAGFVACPACGSGNVAKALMAPAVSTARKKTSTQVPVAADPTRAEMMTKLKQLAKAVKENAENVGDRFPEEARRIHYGESEERGIYGQATIKEAEALMDEGIGVAPLPDFPEDNH